MNMIVSLPRALKTLYVGLMVALLAPIAWGRDAAQHKLDQGLDDSSKFHPVFVRMEDQLLRRGGDYEAFCRDHDNQPRSVVRAQVLKSLHEKADRSWNQIQKKVADLVAAGEIKDATRFWIVNGFACEATPKACKALAGDAGISFVYKQRGPEHVRQHQPAESRPTARAEVAPKTIDQLSPEMRAQVLKELKEKGIDPANVKIRFGDGDDGANLTGADKRALMEKLLQHVRDDSNEPFSTKGLEIPWNLKLIQADQAWEKEGATGKGVVVAVNDGGVVDIPALRPALWRNPREQLNGKDDDGDGYVDDLFGYNFASQTGFILDKGPLNHGTMCAGIIAGRPLPEKPLVTGVAPRARLMLLNGMGYLKAYEYALSHGADVLSMSYMWVNMELGQYRGLFRTAAEHLSAGGVLSLGGAGNFAKSAPAGKQICLPKDIPCVVAVAGVLEDSKRPVFSSMGPCSWSGVRFYDDYPESKPLRKPDLTAPAGGFPCWSSVDSVKDQWKVLWKGNDSDALITGPRGNSFAGPHAAGVAALVLSANPELNAWQVKRILEETCKPLGTPATDYEHGAGLLQALDAVRAAKALGKAKKG